MYLVEETEDCTAIRAAHVAENGIGRTWQKGFVVPNAALAEQKKQQFIRKVILSQENDEIFFFATLCHAMKGSRLGGVKSNWARVDKKKIRKKTQGCPCVSPVVRYRTCSVVFVASIFFSFATQQNEVPELVSFCQRHV